MRLFNEKHTRHLKLVGGTASAATLGYILGGVPLAVAAGQLTYKHLQSKK